MTHIETEFKWEANTFHAFQKMRQAAEELGKLSAPDQVFICDTYMDHTDGQFARQNIAFRVRNIGARWECSFKTKTDLKNGLAVRQEETLALPVKNVHQASAFLTRKKTWQGLNVENLRPTFSLVNRRTIHMLKTPQVQAELAYDAVQFLICGRIVKIWELELELKKGTPKALQALAQKLTEKTGLPLAKISKVETAQAILKIFQSGK